MQSNSRILVTGAGGYVGGWIVEWLFLQGFQNVRAGIRKWSSAARIGRFPVDIVICDVLNQAQVTQAMNGVDVVIHCAYGSKEATIQGTRNVAEASWKQKVERFVHLSTVSVYGGAEGTVNEDQTFQFTGSEYGDTKIEAEQICWEFHKKGLPLVVLRPSAIYGPYDKLWISKFAERLQSRQWGIFEKMGDGQCNLVYIGDLLNAVFLAADSEGAIGEAFNINGSDNITWNDYFNTFNGALNLPALRPIGQSSAKVFAAMFAPVKKSARYLLGHFGRPITQLYQRYDLVQQLMKRAERRMKSTPGREELDMFGRNVHYSISKAGSVLGFEPQFDVQKGLAMSIQWLRHESLLNTGVERN